MKGRDIMNKDRKSLAIEYLNAVGKHQFDKVEALLAPDIQFRGPAVIRTSVGDLVGAFKRLAAIHVRNDLKRVFVDGDEVCIIYDFVTDTPAGPLATVEWLRFEGDRIRSVDLYYDQLPWQTVMAAMAERTARAAAQPTA
jgi:hypothetical protein